MYLRYEALADEHLAQFAGIAYAHRSDGGLGEPLTCGRTECCVGSEPKKGILWRKNISI
jgi:hypothetical protein